MAKMIIKKFIALTCAFSLLLYLTGMYRLTGEAAVLYKIDANTFKGHYDIVQVRVGSDVEEITEMAFVNMLNLKSIIVSENNPYFSSYSNCLYNKDQTVLLCYPQALTGAYIPDTVTEIAPYALHGVDDDIKSQIRSLVSEDGGLSESEISGPHFIHTSHGLLWINKNGSMELPSSGLLGDVASLIDAATSSGQGQETQLRKCYNFLINRMSYERSYDTPTGNWTADYASKALSTGKGNCYGYAAAMAYIADGLGYSARIAVGQIESSNGGTTPHAWTEIKIDNDWYIFDAEMEDATGRDLYKVSFNSYPIKPLVKSSVYTVSLD
ncbi:MAG: transglutaminase domain-containing protein [Butyrivibrio sp.]|nr:transglutaminase domain-containing protein [Butyrivibrio sp.]MCR4832483.1 transglutaminase-like domain-containing protein [Butyrivibrio sp.]